MKQTLRGVDFFVLYYQQQLRKGDTSCELETVALSYDTMHTGVNGQKGGYRPFTSPALTESCDAVLVWWKSWG